MHRRTLLPLVFAVLVAGGLAAGCLPLQAPTAVDDVCGRGSIESGAWKPQMADTPATDIAVVGDSLTFGIAEAGKIDRLTVGHGTNLLMADGRIGCTAVQRATGVDWYAEHHPDVLVIELGTNDVRDASVYAGRGNAIAALMAILEGQRELRAMVDRARADGVGCVVLVGVNEIATSPFDLARFGPSINHTMVDEAKADNVDYADWAAVSGSHPEWFIEDHVHMTPDGSSAFAQLIGDTAATCS